MNFAPFSFLNQQPKSLEFITTSSVNLGGSSYTLSNVSCGGPGLIVVVAQWETTAGGAGSVLNSCTINGNTATIATQVQSAINASRSGVAVTYYRISAGTTINIGLTYSTNILRTLVGVWRIQNNNSDTPIESQTNSAINSTGLSVTMTGLTSNSLAVCATSIGINGLRVTWTNATEVYDLDIGATGFSGADFKTTTTGNRTITTSHTISTQGVTLGVTAWD